MTMSLTLGQMLAIMASAAITSVGGTIWLLIKVVDRHSEHGHNSCGATILLLVFLAGGLGLLATAFLPGW